jgi:Ubiquitin family.
MDTLKENEAIIEFYTLERKTIYGIYDKNKIKFRDIINSLFENYDCPYLKRDKLLFYSYSLRKMIDKKDYDNHISTFDFPTRTTLRLHQRPPKEISNDSDEEDDFDAKTNKFIKKSQFKIFVETEEKKIIILNVTCMNKICDVKKMISDRENMEIDKIKLTFNNNELKDDDYLYKKNIKKKSKLQLNNKIINSNNSDNDYDHNVTYEIYIKLLIGEIISILVKCTDQICDVKNKIYEITGFQVEEIALIYCGIRLSNKEHLYEHNIRHRSQIHLIIRMGGGMYSETSGKNGNYRSLKSIVFRM